ncbi:MAG: hypothetical protein ACLPV8_25430 [Steroidobacteraceae bacterium]
MYAKIFRQMFSGSLATTGPWEALVTFQQMLIVADRDGVVDMTAAAISRETTIPLSIIQTGIDVLERPDPDSRTPDEEGRRIVRLSDSRAWGWRITNYRLYRDLRSEEERREYHRRYWHERRKANATTSTASTSTQQHSTDSTHAEAEASARKNSTARRKRAPNDDPEEFLDLQLVYPNRAGDQGAGRKGRGAWNARLAEGHTAAEMIAGAKRYAAYIRFTGNEGTELVKQIATFLGPDKHFLNPWNPPAARKPVSALALRSDEVRANSFAREMGHPEMNPGENLVDLLNSMARTLGLPEMKAGFDPPAFLNLLKDAKKARAAPALRERIASTAAALTAVAARGERR